ncbi:hypothetical protein J2W91_004594 [Paenibacillus amylolyticus]|uniref:Uncharacterized protein n=1 Tax=Paenibacillus amylolyticus TaxID=1451 RepID=A0AAP5H7B6_PAEAM|nr:hypothetical protein [Paenibacillus amylolyticus]MDR6726088.1 hypothetical protein [Paenibacillus amylolyticus]
MKKVAAEGLIKKGIEELTRMLQYFDRHPNFTMIRYRVPFIEFNTRGDIIRLQRGKPVMLAAYDKRSGWLDA